MHNYSPLISIILPVYNGEKFLSQSIQSCLDQTYSNLELIIVNDASTDSSINIANTYSATDNRIRVISNPQNLNLPTSLNIGHKAAKGEFLTWTSDDNFYSPNALEILLNELVNKQADIVFSDFNIINDKDEPIGKYEFNSEHSILLENIIRASFLYRKEVFLKNNGYKENLFKIEDYEFWLNASRYAIIKHIDQKLYFYRSHSNSLTFKKTLSQFRYKQEYVDKVKEMYRLFFNSFDLKPAEEISEIFCSLHLHQQIDVSRFVKSFVDFKKNMQVILQKYGKEKVLKEIDHRIRYNIQRYPSNQNFKTILIVFINRPSILFKYSKRRTLKILYLTLLKRSSN